jgi:hypothetical protein
MKALWPKIQAWRERRRVLTLERWGRTRVKGKPRFMIWTTVWFASLMTAWFTLTDGLRHGGYYFEHLALNISTALIGGFIVGLLTWWTSKSKYFQYLHERRDRDSRSTR